jgi:hypothetical protein
MACPPLSNLGLKFVPGEYVINYWATLDPKSRMLKKLESNGGLRLPAMPLGFETGTDW